MAWNYEAGPDPDVARRSAAALLVTHLLKWAWASPGSAIGLLVGGIGLACGGKCRRIRGVLEFDGPVVAAFLKHIGRGAGAMTLGHVILGRSATDLDWSRDHEHVHVRQYERWGPFFLPAYGLASLWQSLRGRHAYWDNPFEREAYSWTREIPQGESSSEGRGL